MAERIASAIGNARNGRRRNASTRGGARAAFTLIEVLIVTTLVAILASVVIPTVFQNTDEAKLTSLKHNETLLNQVIGTYKAHHNGNAPDVDTGELPQLFAATNVAGVAGTGAAFPYGPYLAGTELPINTRTESRVVAEVAQMPPAAYLGGGWLYHKATGQIMADGTPGDPVAPIDP